MKINALYTLFWFSLLVANTSLWLLYKLNFIIEIYKRKGHIYGVWYGMQVSAGGLPAAKK
jgi:hypothetical protein